MAKKTITKLSELTPDSHNYNKGTEFGGALIQKSLQKLGAGRSILLDKNGNVIAGNKTLENAVSAGFGDDDLIVVQTTGKQIVAVQRMDLDLKSKRGKEMALADNATAKANIDWDTEALAADWDSDELDGWGVRAAWESDYSDKNVEVDVNGFSSTMEMKFKFEQDDFMDVQERLNVVCSKQNVETKEEALKELLMFYERHCA